MLIYHFTTNKSMETLRIILIGQQKENKDVVAAMCKSAPKVLYDILEAIAAAVYWEFED